MFVSSSGVQLIQLEALYMVHFIVRVCVDFAEKHLAHSGKMGGEDAL